MENFRAYSKTFTPFGKLSRLLENFRAFWKTFTPFGKLSRLLLFCTGADGVCMSEGGHVCEFPKKIPIEYYEGILDLEAIHCR